MVAGVVVRYSEAFKLQVVRELEQGRFKSVGAAQRAYGVKGVHTVAAWIRRFGKDHLLGKVVRVMKADEEAEVQALRKRVRELERALADAHLDLKLEAAYLKLACEAAGVRDVAEFKKKGIPGSKWVDTPGASPRHPRDLALSYQSRGMFLAALARIP